MQTPTYSEHQWKQTEADSSDEGTIGYKMKKGKFRQGKIPTYSRASVYESQADSSDEEIIG